MYLSSIYNANKIVLCCAVCEISRLGMLRPAHWLQSLLHFIQLFISLSLMLVFMTFNVYLCLAVTVGGAIGYLCFAWIRPKPVAQRYDAVCH